MAEQLPPEPSNPSNSSEQHRFTLAQTLGLKLTSHGLTIATAESCTGGWVAQAITAVPGSSQWFDRGFVTYTNEAKVDMLGVSEETLAHHGAVSEQTVLEMARGAMANSRSQVSVAISGVAGPDGGSPEKPVGFVWFGFGLNDKVVAKSQRFSGDRRAVREQAVVYGLNNVMDLIGLL